MAARSVATNLEAMLRRVPLLARLDERQRQTLSRLFTPTRATAGQVIVLQGQPVESFIVVASGELSLSRHSPEGRQRVVARLRSGTHFGLAEMITGEGSVVTVQAEQDSTLAVLNGQAFRREVLGNPALSYSLMQTMARSIFRLVRQLDAATFENAPQRVARCLLALAGSQGVVTDRGIEVFHAPTHQDVAHLIGASRETVTRALAAMKRAGLVELGYRRLTILDKEGLAACAQAAGDAKLQ